MRRSRWLAAGAAVAALSLSALVLPGRASAAGVKDTSRAVFVQTNNPNGNTIVAFERHTDGTLTWDATYPTGGKGGRTNGSGSDSLASQGSLRYDERDGLLLAVNAGSDTVSVFRVAGDDLHLNQVLWSGGSFPVSIALHDDLAYVLDAGSTGTVSGYRVSGGRLHPISDSQRSLGLANSNPPFFLSSPAQAGFTPDGGNLLVTTKTNATVDVFGVEHDGRLTDHPVKNAVNGVPFAFRFDRADQLALVNAADGSLGIYSVSHGGTLTAVGTPASDGQTAACWIAAARGFNYVANTGSGTISQFSIGHDGAVTLDNGTAASGVSGAIDLTGDGNALYAQSGLSSTVQVFSVAADGTLVLIQSESVPDGSSQEGIVAT